MSSKYVSPQLLPVLSLPEGKCRALLAALLLAPGKTPAEQWLYRQARTVLFELDARCIRENCLFAAQAPLQRYQADLRALTGDIFCAAGTLLQTGSCTLQYTVDRFLPAMPLYPRPLQFALIGLLRAAAIPENRRIYAIVSGTAWRCAVTVTADHALREDAVLSCSAAVAALHGGCLLRTARSVGFCIGVNENAADPRWFSPGADGLLQDPLSCVRAGLHAV